VYNHLASTIWNLGAHCREDLIEHAAEEGSEKYQIMATAAALNVLLDVDQPWTFIVNDPDGSSHPQGSRDVVIMWFCVTGVSEFKPSGLEDGKVQFIQNPAPDCKVTHPVLLTIPVFI
jgi:hypothetical protein